MTIFTQDGKCYQRCYKKDGTYYDRSYDPDRTPTIGEMSNRLRFGLEQHNNAKLDRMIKAEKRRDDEVR